MLATARALIVVPAIALSIAATAAASSVEPPLPPVLSNWSLQDLTVPTGLPQYVNMTVTLDGQPTDLYLWRRSLRSAAFQVLVDDGSGELTPVAAPDFRTYRGIIVGDEASGVTMSILDNGVSMMIRTSAGNTYMVEPVTTLVPDAVGDTRHAVYAASDVIPTGHFCALDTSGVSVPPMEGGIAGANPNYAEVAFDTDFEMYTKDGSSVSGTILDLENVWNTVDFVYDRDVNITYEITTIIVRSSSSDPYSSTTIDGRLCEFRNKWNASPEVFIQRDLAQMFSGFAFSGGAIGLAWLGTACNVSGTASGCAGSGNLAYSIVESKFNSPVTAMYLRVALSCHEAGHIWNATHCDSQGNANCHIMCSIIDGCGGLGGGGANMKFDTLSINEITTYKDSVGCEPVLASAVTPPFTDTFPSVVINTSNWIWNKGGNINSNATNEPSPSLSLNLDSTGNTAYEDDEIRSNKILLGGAAGATATYWTEHKGVEAGKTLFVDYWPSSGDWTNLETITSDGTDQATFVKHEFQLPANALHDAFRIRFRTDGADGTDDWYIDDVTVAVGFLCPGDLDHNGSVDGADLGLLLSKWNTNDANADLNHDGIVDGADLGLLLSHWGPC